MAKSRQTQLYTKTRVETGPVKLIAEGEEPDWTGVLIRGDSALYYALAVEQALEVLDDQEHFYQKMQLRTLSDLLRSGTEGYTSQVASATEE